MTVRSFTFNPFQENTYVVHNGSEGILVDPGCWKLHEEQELADWLEQNGITPVRLVLTHAHIDHVLGCAWVLERFGLKPQVHKADLPLLQAAPHQGALWGIHCDPVPEPEVFLEPGGSLALGEDKLDILFVPGHAPGHIALYHNPLSTPSASLRTGSEGRGEAFVVSGDVLFNGSIGRTDLPGGDFDVLAKSIREVMYPLGDEVIVYSGHGDPTTIGKERRTNPFVKG
ncbi:MAG: MBL fold metallo-hydrolase [Flavobacteriales bacterium]|nr:MAG: MBL fold metallo-hydrolase [Flavobacteriales bacterium]